MHAHYMDLACFGFGSCGRGSSPGVNGPCRSRGWVEHPAAASVPSWQLLAHLQQPPEDKTEEPVALPQLSAEQRTAALQKAAVARRVRAELKERLKRGGTDIKAVLNDAESNDILGKMKVSALLAALPKVGKVKAQELMTELDIAPTRRLRGLGERQRNALLAKFDQA